MRGEISLKISSTGCSLEDVAEEEEEGEEGERAIER